MLISSFGSIIPWLAKSIGLPGVSSSVISSLNSNQYWVVLVNQYWSYLVSAKKKRLKPRFLPAQKENCLVLVSKVQCNYSIVLGNHQCLIHFHQFVFWLFGLFPATNYPSWVCSPLLFVSLWLTFLRCHWNRLFSLGASNCSHAPISFKIQQKSIRFNLTRGLSTSNLT